MSTHTLAPDPIGATGAFSAPEVEPLRAANLQQLFITNYGIIRDAVATEQSLLVGDIDNIANSIARYLDNYTGPVEQSAFIEWATSLAKESAQQLAAFCAMKAEHSGTVRKAIGSVLKSCAGLGISHALDEIEQDVWVRVLKELPEWLTPGYSKTPGRKPASIDTRLYRRAYWTARAWKTSRVRECEKFADADIFDTQSDPTGIRGRKVVCAVEY